MHIDITNLEQLSTPTAVGKLCVAGSTVLTGLPPACSTCGELVRAGKFKGKSTEHGWEGYFVGTYCSCGLYSRETWMLRSKELADITFNVFKATGKLLYKRDAA